MKIPFWIQILFYLGMPTLAFFNFCLSFYKEYKLGLFNKREKHTNQKRPNKEVCITSIEDKREEENQVENDLKDIELSLLLKDTNKSINTECVTIEAERDVIPSKK